MRRESGPTLQDNRVTHPHHTTLPSRSAGPNFVQVEDILGTASQVMAPEVSPQAIVDRALPIRTAEPRGSGEVVSTHSQCYLLSWRRKKKCHSNHLGTNHVHSLVAKPLKK